MDKSLRMELQQDLDDALKRIDTLIAEEEQRELEHVSEQFSCVVGSLVKLRDHVTQANRQGIHVAELPSIEEVNAMISVMASVEYPRVGIQWPRIKQIRDTMETLIHSRTHH